MALRIIFFVSLVMSMVLAKGQTFKQDSTQYAETIAKLQSAYFELKDLDSCKRILRTSRNTFIRTGKRKRKERKVLSEWVTQYYRWETLVEFDDSRRTVAAVFLDSLLDRDQYFVFEDFGVPYHVDLEKFFTEAIDERNKNVVFINKHGSTTEQIPSVLTVYTREDIKQLGVRHLLDLLRLTPGYAELGDNNERNFGTRGVGGTTVQHVLFLLNGHRLNDLLTGTAGPDWISLDYVEQVEIITGPGSALYGGNAFSGVINIITKTGVTHDYSEFNLDVGTGVFDFDDFDVYDHTYKANFQVGKRLGATEGFYFSGTTFLSGGSQINPSSQLVGEKVDVLADISTIYGSNDGRTSDTIPDGAVREGYEYINRYRPGYNLVLNYVKKSFNVLANAQSNKFEYARPSSHNLWNFDSLTLPHQDMRRRIDKREFVELQFNALSHSNFDSSDFIIKGSFDHFRKDFFINLYSDPDFFNFRDSLVDESFVRLAGDEFRFSGALEFSTQKLSFLGEKSFTLIGLNVTANTWNYEYYTPYAVENDGDTSVHLTSAPGQDYFMNFSHGRPDFKEERTFALYGQTEKHIIEDELLLTLGLSLNYHPIFANFDGGQEVKASGDTVVKRKLDWGNGLSPKAALVYSPKIRNHNFFNVKGLINSAFVPPAFLYRNGGIKAFTGSVSLKSQHMSSYEISIFGDTRELDTLSNEWKTEKKVFGYQINGYYNVLNDLITRQSAADPYSNGDQKQFVGFELSAYYKLKSLKFFTTLSRSTVRDDTILYYPGLIYTGGVHWNIENVGKEGRVYANLNFNVYRDIHVNFPNFPTDDNETDWDENPYSAYNMPIFNLNVHYENDKFDLGINIHNLFNTDYHLPSRISRLGVMRGEKMMAMLQLGYNLDRK